MILLQSTARRRAPSDALSGRSCALCARCPRPHAYHLSYLSEVERGRKEASSELLAAICAALETPLSQVFREVSDNFALAELQNEPGYSAARRASPGCASPASGCRSKRSPRRRARSTTDLDGLDQTSSVVGV